jgi:hypothetical protein
MQEGLSDMESAFLPSFFFSSSFLISFFPSFFLFFLPPSLLSFFLSSFFSFLFHQCQDQIQGLLHATQVLYQ